MTDINTIIKQKRYSTKHFDPAQPLSPAELEQLKALLQYSPSSTNVQPWHFILATTAEGKARVARATQGFYSFNEQKVHDAGAVIVFASRTQISEEYLQHVLACEEADGRFANEELKAQNHMGRSIFVGFHQYDYKDLQHWADKQVYLNLGYFLFGTAAMGLDTIAMEGADMKVLDEEFDLRARGFTSAFIVAVGHHAENDFNAKLPKSRLPQEEIIEEI